MMATAGKVDMVITDMAVFEVNRGKSRLTLLELAPDVSLDEVPAKTELPLEVAV